LAKPHQVAPGAVNPQIAAALIDAPSSMPQ
jgi:hypothetical protein